MIRDLPPFMYLTALIASDFVSKSMPALWYRKWFPFKDPFVSADEGNISMPLMQPYAENISIKCSLVTFDVRYETLILGNLWFDDDDFILKQMQ